MIIGIVHHESTKKFLPALLKSLIGVKYEVQVIVQNKGSEMVFESASFPPFMGLFNRVGGFELGALYALMTMNPQENNFFLLPESCIIKDQTMFDIASQFKGSLAMSPGFASFMGKYRREVLEEIGIPVPQSRRAAIYYEKYWNELYMSIEKNMAMADSPLLESNVFDMLHGRKNMVLESAYMRKYKSNWGGLDLSTIHN